MGAAIIDNNNQTSETVGMQDRPQVPDPPDLPDFPEVRTLRTSGLHLTRSPRLSRFQPSPA